MACLIFDKFTFRIFFRKITMRLLCITALFVAFFPSSQATWHTWSHGNKGLVSGMAFMESSNTKLFGVGGDGKLYERVWTGSLSGWHWVDHGSPPHMWNGEKLLSTPCALRDGKLFTVTTHGRLVEFHWSGGSWHWAHHGKAMGHVSINHKKCVATRANSRDRVLVVGIDHKVYQLLWTNPQGQWGWRWRAHVDPPNGAKVS